jgi:hypothetical protein
VDRDRSAELRIPTIAIPVRIAIVCDRPEGLAIEQAELFVADAPRRGRSQMLDDLAELLDAPLTFVPVRIGGTVRLVAKSSILCVAIRRRDPDALPSTEFPDEPSEVLMLYDRQHRVEIELLHGSKLEGLLLDSSPADRPRAIDHLNHAVHFIRLWTQQEHVLINKAQIVAVTELPEVE